MGDVIGQMLTRELANNNLFLTFLSLVLLFGVYLVAQSRTVPGWYSQWKNKAAIALLFIAVGATLQRGWSYVLTWRWYEGSGLQELMDIETAFPVSLVGAVITLIGAACLARVFAPAKWGNWTWIVGVPVILGLSWVMHLFLDRARAG